MGNTNVSSGSASDSREREFTAAQLTPAPRRQTADSHGWLWTAICRPSPASAMLLPRPAPRCPG